MNSQCGECSSKRLVARREADDRAAPPTVPPIVEEVVHSPGHALDQSTQAFMKQRFGHDFSQVRVHTDQQAAVSAQAVNALAYTVANDVVFAAEQYAPHSNEGRRLLAHELTHVMQQSSGGHNQTLQRQPAPGAGPAQATETRPTPTIRVGVIPVREFIRHVEVVERAYPTKTPQEILTMIRSLYYGSAAGSPGFDRLIPDAPNTGALETCSDDEGNVCTSPVGVCTCVLAQGFAIDRGELEQSVRRLRQRADENEIADNPSPYIQVGSELIDVGHLLVGADAILHPRTDAPFSTHSMPAAPGPSTWVGDVGAAMVYLKEHERSGHKSSDVKGNPSPTVEDYYHNSAPMEDILGDVDAFVITQFIGPQNLSTALRYLYVSESGGAPRVTTTRWREFTRANNLAFTQSGTIITFTPDTRQNVIQRITDFANLFAGRGSPITAMTVGISPQPWPRAGEFADRFLRDVKARLEAELEREATSQQGSQP